MALREWEAAKKDRASAHFFSVSGLVLSVAGVFSGARKTISSADFFTFVKKRTKIPADPQNLSEINHFIQERRASLKSSILGQDQMVDTTLSIYRNLLLPSGDKPQVVALMGPTGVGKTYLAESVAESLFGGKHRFFKIDGAAYSDESVSLTGLLGDLS